MGDLPLNEARRLKGSGGRKRPPETSGGRPESGSRSAEMARKKRLELAARREAVVQLRAQFTQLSERRACGLVGIQRSSWRYRGSRAEMDSVFAKRLKALALEYPRFGYRRLAVLVRREQQPVHDKRIRWVYQSQRLLLRKRKWKRVQRQPAPLIRLSEPNQEWAMDFVHDAAGNGQKLPFLRWWTSTREPVCGWRWTPRCRQHGGREREAAIAEHGKPARIQMDNSSELTSRRFLAWAAEEKIEIVHIRPGKPIENAHYESFNSRLRKEFLNATAFQHLWDARAQSADWLRHYNESRPQIPMS